MSKELPHASLQCSECGTSFRVTLKKGRVPSKPIPCPKCKVPITVAESDIVTPGKKKSASRAGGSSLRQTKPGQDLRKTKLASVSSDGVASIMDDPPTAEVQASPDDPPTAEVELDPDEIAASADESAPAFGIISGKKISKRPGETEDDPFRKETPLGVDVARPTGRGRRDNVFGDRTSSSVAIGRIRTKQVSSLDKQLDPDDPDLPASASEATDDAASDEPQPAAAKEAEEAPRKLDLSKLRSMMNKLELEVEDDGEDDDFKNPLDEFDLDSGDVDDLISEGSEDLDDLEVDLLADEDVDEDAAELSDGEDEADEPVADVEPSAPEVAVDSEPDEVPEPVERDEPVEVEPAMEIGGDADLEVEPTAGTLDVEESEAYSLGEAEVPARIPEAPRSRGLGGVIFGLIMLAVVAAVAFIMFT